MAYKVFLAPTGSGNTVFEGDVLNGYTSPDGRKVVLKFFSNDRGYTCGSFNTDLAGAKGLREELAALLEQSAHNAQKFSAASAQKHFTLMRELDGVPLILSIVGADPRFGTSHHRGDAEALKKVLAEFDQVLKTIEDAVSGKWRPRNPRSRRLTMKPLNAPPSTVTAPAHKIMERPGAVPSFYPTVALVGRPNVGKSSLFNALLKQDISITDARPGTTRDRVLHPAVIHEKHCDLMDTGGIGIIDKAEIGQEIEAQIQKALHAATVLALVVDAKEGLTPLDREVAARLRTLNRPMFLVANKSEGKEAKLTINEFSELGIQPIVVTSASHRLGLDDLEDAIAERIGTSPDGGELEGLPHLAVVGRRNVGKSSFCNALAREERTIVSSIPGTTRDSVDILLEKDNRRFCLVDTAGLRHIREPEGPVEFFAQVRTERAIRRADVVLLMLAAPEGVSNVDRKTAMMIVEECKPCLIVVNKWDLKTSAAVTGDFLKYLEIRLPQLRAAPIAFTAASTGARCWQAIDVALDLYKQSSTEISTPELNRAVEDAEFEHEPPVIKSRKPRLLYGVQVGVRPPTFVLHCRHADKIDERYKRYLSGRLREKFGLLEVPVRIFLREAKR